MIINELKEISNIHHVVLPSENCIDRVEKLSEVFQNLADCLTGKKDYMAELQAKEAGKPIRYGRIEVERCINQLNQAHSFLRMHFSNVKCILEKKYIPLGNTHCLKNPGKIQQLSQGVLECSKKYMWENRVKIFNEVYEKAALKYNLQIH